MRITIVPASTQVGKATIEALLRADDPPQIRAIYRNTSKAPIEFIDNPSFQAIHGGLDNGLDLDFADSDAVLFVPPPTYDDKVDSGDHAISGASKVKAALQKSDTVQRLVVLSALGAQHSDGIGILKLNHITDEILAESAPEVLIARPGWFQENWAETLGTAKSDEPFFETYFSPVDHEIVMISVVDVGQILAQQLLDTGKALPSHPYVIGLHGPRNYSMLDLQDVLDIVTGKKPRIDVVQPENLLEFYKRWLPPTKAEEFKEMTVAINGGGLLAAEMARPGGNIVRGSTELIDTLRQLASGERAKVSSGPF